MLRRFDRRDFLKPSIFSGGFGKVARSVANNFQLAPASKPQRVVFVGTRVFTGPPTARRSETANAPVTSTVPARPPYIKFRTFVWLVLLLVGLGILRSAITTRLDGFTIDEAYHVAAGVSYVKYTYPAGLCRFFRISSARNKSVRRARRWMEAFRLSINWELIMVWARTS
jgi:hypothetical protein